MADKIKHLSKYLTPFNIFAAFCLIGFAGYLFIASRHGAAVTDYFMMENIDLRFCDLIMHVEYVGDPQMLYVDRAIGWQGCFPPLSYLLYFLMSRLLTRDGVVPGVGVPIDSANYLYCVIMYYSVAVAVLILYGIQIYARENTYNYHRFGVEDASGAPSYGEKSAQGLSQSRTENALRRGWLIFICLMISVPFYAGGMSVANSTMLVMALLLIALKLRESESPARREIALLLIAACAGFKIYPAIFGLFYLTEKRFKEAARLTIYGIVLFFAPFACFGGMNGLTHWLMNVKETMGFMDYGRIQSIRGLLVTLARDHGMQESIPAAVYSLAPIVFLLIMLALAAVSKNRYRRVFFLCAIMAFFPTNAYRYTLAYLAIPFIMYFMEDGRVATNALSEDSKENSNANAECKKETGTTTAGPHHSALSSRINTTFIYIETIMFSLVFAMPVVYAKIRGFRPSRDIYTYTQVERWLYFWAYLLMLLVTVHEVWALIRSRKLRQK